MLSQWETNVNALANRTMASDEYSSQMNGAMGMTLRMQEMIRDSMAPYLAATNLPSRTEVLAIAERLGAVEARLDRITTLLEQIASAKSAAASAAPAGAQSAAPPPRRGRGRRAPRVRRRQPSRLREPDRRAHPERSRARDPAQRQRAGVLRLARARGRPDAQRRHLRAGHAAPVPLPPDRGRALPHPDPDRDGDEQPRLHPRPRARPELGRVPAAPRLRRLPDRLEPAARGRPRLAVRGLHAAVHPRVRAARARRQRRRAT